MKLINHTFKEKKYIIKTNQNINKKIALISDLHFSSKFKKEKSGLIIDKIKTYNPDYICIPGDLIDSYNVLEDQLLKEHILSFVKSVSLIAKTIISIGNHDNSILIQKGFRCKSKYIENKEWFETLKKIKNVIILDNEKIIDKDITFVGFTASRKYYEKELKNESLMIEELNEKMPQLNNETFNILLCHSPRHILNEKTIKETEIKNVDLILSGHMHNGMVPPILDDIIKGNKGIFSPDNTWLFKTKFTRGSFELNGKKLIISGAITKIHDCSPNILIPLNELFPMSIEFIELN